MAELKLHITADTQDATQGVSKVTDSIESLRKTYIKSGEGLDDYVKRVDTDLDIIDSLNEGMKSLEKRYARVTKELTWVKRAYGSSNDAAKVFAAAQSSLKAEMDKASEAARQQKAAVEAQKASMAKVEEQYRLIIEHEKERAKAIEDANNAAIESWRRYVEFASSQQSKLDAIQNASNAKAQSASASAYTQRYDTSVGSTANDMAFYDAIGDSASKARLELSMYEQQLRRVLAAENASPAAVEAATEAYRQQKAAVEKLENVQDKHSSKFASIFKNILKFQLVMMPIQKTIRFVRDTITDSMKVAAEAEQVFNKLSTVFENNAAAMGRAQQMAQSYGTSISTMASSLSTVGDLLQAQGMGRSSSLDLASEWTAAFSDIIAFKDINMTVEEFAQNFMSGAAGNLRNFRTFGSIVKETAVNAELAKRGLSDLTGEELELQKMVIRATMALDQQKNSIGATEREWDTVLSINRRLNEQWKQFKENLGSMFNEALSPIKSWLSDILTIANKVTAAVNEINSGEFTIKVQQTDSDELKDTIKELFALTADRRSDSDPISSSNGFLTKIKQALVVASYAQSGQAMTAASVARDYNTLSSKDISDIMMATGATLKQVQDAFEDTAYSIEEGAWDAAQKIVDLNTEAINRQDARTKQLQALEESVIQDYRDNLASMFTNTGDMASWLKGDSFADHTSAEFVLGRNKGTIEENATQGAKEIAAILNYIRTTAPKMASDRSSLESQLSTARTAFDEKAVALDGIVWSKGNGWSQEEALEQYKLIERLQRQIDAIDSTTAAWEEMDETLSVRLRELYEQKAKETASSSVADATSDLAASNASDARRLELEKQYKDGLSYMVDILMQEYEYGLKYAEMQKSLIDAGYTELEATDILASYKDEYSKAIAAATKAAEDAASKEKKAKEKANSKEWSDYLKGLRLTMPSTSPYAKADEWKDTAESEAMEKLNKEVGDGTITMLQFFERMQEVNGIIDEEYEARKKLIEQQQYQSSMDSIYGAFGEAGGIVKTVASWSPEDFAQFASIGAEGGLPGGFAGFASSAIGGDVIAMLAQLASQLEVVQKAGSLLSDTLVPVIDALLKPLSDTLDVIKGGLQDLLVNVLNPSFKLIRSIMVPLNDTLSVLFDIAGDLLELLQPMENILVSILPIVMAAISAVNALLQMLDPIIEACVMLANVLSPIAQAVIIPIVNAIKGLFELLIIGFTYVEVFFKKVVGNIGLAFMNVWNSIVSVLRSIDILGWRPFSGMGYADTSKMEAWTKHDYEEEISKKLDKLNGTVEDVKDTNLSIAKNTEKDVDLSFLNELLASGEIDERGYNERAKVKQAGLRWDTVKPTKEGYIDFSNRQTTVSRGNVTVVINGGDPEEVRKAVASALKEAGMDPDGMGYRDYA